MGNTKFFVRRSVFQKVKILKHVRPVNNTDSFSFKKCFISLMLSLVKSRVVVTHRLPESWHYTVFPVSSNGNSLITTDIQVVSAGIL